MVGLNVLDCVSDPHALLASLPRLLRPGGKAILSTPYDWSPRATPLGSWIGGHSQRGENAGASEPVLRALLTPGGHPAAIEGLRIVAEETSLPWRVRMHERSSVEYRVDSGGGRGYFGFRYHSRGSSVNGWYFSAGSPDW